MYLRIMDIYWGPKYELFCWQNACYSDQHKGKLSVLFFKQFYVRLLDYSILFKARHDELFTFRSLNIHGTDVLKIYCMSCQLCTSSTWYLVAFQVFLSIFLSAFLLICLLCWHHWSSDVMPTLDAALLCSSRQMLKHIGHA